MNVVIIEDSRLARQELQNLLLSFDGFTLVGEAENMEAGIALIEKEKPDLILLDIHLPDGDGFTLLERLDHIPQVIFTTAYDQHAVAAFEVNALDYLLKPVEKDRLADALSRAMESNNNNIAAKPTQDLDVKSRNDRVFIREGDQCYFVCLADIYLCEVIGNYTRVYFDDKKPMLAKALSYLEQRLDSNVFFRANRQQIVNLDYITSVEPWLNDGLLLKLNNGSEVEVSRRQAKELRALLEL